MGGHPNRDTVSSIFHDYVDNGCCVAALQGRAGILHSTRKFGPDEFDALMIIIHDNEQFLLSGIVLAR